MKNWIRKLLRRFLGKDYILLRTDWNVVFHDANYLVIGNTDGAQKRVLPIRYNQHTISDWDLKYLILGNEEGTLTYRLSLPDEPFFAELKLPAQLPFSLNIRLENGALLGNGIPLVLSNGSVRSGASLLSAQFEFRSGEGSIATRRAAHRVKFVRDEIGSDYFTGAVYDSYEIQAAQIPKRILNTIQKFRPLTGRFLDVGCATGLLVSEAARVGMEAEGVDVSDWAVRQAVTRMPGKCRVLNLDTATLTDFSDRYDVITANSVIEHFAEPERALRLLFDLCKPKGVVYIQTLNADSLLHKLLGSDWAGFTDYTHKSPWITADWLETNARAVGFRVLTAIRGGVWLDAGADEVWASFASLIQFPPASTLLQEGLGDEIELILMRD